MSLQHELDEREVALLQNYCDVFMGDFRFKVTGKQVIFYVAAWQGDLYFKSLGRYPKPQLVIDAIKAHPVYKERSQISPAQGVRTAIKSMRHK